MLADGHTLKTADYNSTMARSEFLRKLNREKSPESHFRMERKDKLTLELLPSIRPSQVTPRGLNIGKAFTSRGKIGGLDENANLATREVNSSGTKGTGSLSPVSNKHPYKPPMKQQYSSRSSQIALKFKEFDHEKLTMLNRDRQPAITEPKIKNRQNAQSQNTHRISPSHTGISYPSERDIRSPLGKNYSFSNRASEPGLFDLNYHVPIGQRLLDSEQPVIKNHRKSASTSNLVELKQLLGRTSWVDKKFDPPKKSRKPSKGFLMFKKIATQNEESSVIDYLLKASSKSYLPHMSDKTYMTREVHTNDKSIKLLKNKLKRYDCSRLKLEHVINEAKNELSHQKDECRTLTSKIRLAAHAQNPYSLKIEMKKVREELANLVIELSMLDKANQNQRNMIKIQEKLIEILSQDPTDISDSKLLNHQTSNPEDVVRRSANYQQQDSKTSSLGSLADPGHLKLSLLKNNQPHVSTSRSHNTPSQEPDDQKSKVVNQIPKLLSGIKDPENSGRNSRGQFTNYSGQTKPRPRHRLQVPKRESQITERRQFGRRMETSSPEQSPEIAGSNEGVNQDPPATITGVNSEVAQRSQLTQNISNREGSFQIFSSKMNHKKFTQDDSLAEGKRRLSEKDQHDLKVVRVSLLQALTNLNLGKVAKRNPQQNSKGPHIQNIWIPEAKHDRKLTAGNESMYSSMSVLSNEMKKEDSNEVRKRNGTMLTKLEMGSSTNIPDAPPAIINLEIEGMFEESAYCFYIPGNGSPEAKRKKQKRNDHMPGTLGSVTEKQTEEEAMTEKLSSPKTNFPKTRPSLFKRTSEG